jgi:hypothetical protein
MQDALISWPNLEQWRDVVIVAYSLMGFFAFLVFTLVMLLIARLLWGVRGAIRDLLEDPVRPTLEEVKKTVQNVRGTSEFVSDQAVHPVIRTVAVVRSIRRGISSITGIRARRG